MPRSLKKGPYVHPSITEKLSRARVGDAVTIKTWSRDTTITPEMIGVTFLVHNGRTFTEVKAREEMVGHCLGEFSPTRKFIRHGGRVQKEIEQKAAEAETAKAKAEKK